MAVKAFVLVEVTAGKSKKVVDDLTAIRQQVKEIQSVDMVTGPYDIITIMEGPDINAIGNLVTKHIQSVIGVARTVTCLTIKLE